MRIVVSAEGETLEAQASPVFGRCPTYIFVDTETMQAEVATNPAMNQGGGAGIQAAQFVVNQGAQAVLTGNLGPKAFDVLEAAGIKGYLLPKGTVRQAVEAFAAGRLQPMGGASVAAHSGMGRGMPPSAPVQPPSKAAAPDRKRESELAQLRESLKELRQRLAETMDRIEQLERGS